ncbi:glycosyl hydrolase family 28 protein [Lapidilactobacillus luobeiensis]|uniref:glycosyl hydrolase family 28 protein n=1 Tax=Lapidilactobacillus luobeiensis TaxID=2950371 RepID=UPI0021C499BE|nr:glycosyl hydrolase family 28 protein [Lapidilactobacillus luobeiensis]
MIERIKAGPIVGVKIAPATLSSSQVTLIWDRPQEQGIQGYQVWQDEKMIERRSPNQTHVTVSSLKPETSYFFKVVVLLEHQLTKIIGTVTVTTMAKEVVFDVTQAPYNADKTGKTVCTEVIQQAINDCPPLGIVYLPKGATVLSGALELKDDLTLQIDGTLNGSLDPLDYLVKAGDPAFKGQANAEGLVRSRYEGWEMYCYRSLINAGYLDPNDRSKMVCHNVRVCGSGVIHGGGTALGEAMKSGYTDLEKYPQYLSDNIPGRRVRGRLLSFVQCQNVHLTGVTIENPSSWTVHLVYCDTVTTNGVSINSRGIDNGDGWDPDSTRNAMIFDTSFDTGDDCIAIKSGKNPEGNEIGIPTENVRIFDLKMLGGHGLAIGSEMSGGVADVQIHDCLIQGTNYGIELKAHNDRGGYIRNFTATHCLIDSFEAQSVDYNSDGTAAKELPVFADISLVDCQITGKQQAITLIGFSDQQNHRKGYLERILLKNLTLSAPTAAAPLRLHFERCAGLKIEHVHLASPAKFSIDLQDVHGLQITDLVEVE